jgi:hypothetical protein
MEINGNAHFLRRVFDKIAGSFLQCHRLYPHQKQVSLFLATMRIFLEMRGVLADFLRTGDISNLPAWLEAAILGLRSSRCMLSVRLCQGCKACSRLGRGHGQVLRLEESTLTFGKAPGAAVEEDSRCRIGILKPGYLNRCKLGLGTAVYSRDGDHFYSSGAYGQASRSHGADTGCDSRG